MTLNLSNAEKMAIWCSLSELGIVYYFYYDLGVKKIRDIIRHYKQLEEIFGEPRECHNLEDFKMGLETLMEFGFMKVKDGEIQELYLPRLEPDITVINETRELLRKYYKGGNK